MALTITGYSRKSALGGKLCMQACDITIESGDTSATMTAPSISSVNHVILPHGIIQSAAPTFSGNQITLAFSVPTATAATLTKGGVTYTAVATDNTGNLISVAYTGGATAGAEVVTIVGNAISVQIESGVSTITQVRTAVNASAEAAALVTATGTSGTAVSTATASFLTGGITGGVAGTALVFGN